MCQKQLDKAKGKLYGPKASLLTAYLLQERRKRVEERYFQPYLENLPVDCSGFPICFNEEELGYLEGSPILRGIESNKN